MREGEGKASQNNNEGEKKRGKVTEIIILINK